MLDMSVSLCYNRQGYMIVKSFLHFFYIGRKKMGEENRIRKRPATCQRTCRGLCDLPARLGPIKRGGIYKAALCCGKPRCRCHRDARARHGPYWFWTSKAAGKSPCRKLDSKALIPYREYSANHKKFKRIIKKMELTSDELIKRGLKLARLDSC